MSVFDRMFRKKRPERDAGVIAEMEPVPPVAESKIRTSIESLLDTAESNVLPRGWCAAASRELGCTTAYVARVARERGFDIGKSGEPFRHVG